MHEAVITEPDTVETAEAYLGELHERLEAAEAPRFVLSAVELEETTFMIQCCIR